MPGPTTTLGPFYTLTLAPGFPVCNEVSPGVFQQTWAYDLSLTNPNNIPSGNNVAQQLAFQLCPFPSNLVVDCFSTTNRPCHVMTPPNEPCMSLQPTVLRELRFTGLNTNLDVGRYTFILNGCFTSTDIIVSLKNGGPPETTGCNFGTITGPSCTAVQPPVPPTRGVDISKVDDIVTL